MFLTSLILGIASIVFSWVPGLGILLGIAALIISIIAMVKRSKNKEAKNRGMAIAGLITSIVGFIAAIILTCFVWIPAILVFSTVNVKSATNSVKDLNSVLESVESNSFSEYSYKTMTGSDVKSAIRKYYNKSDFILEVQAEYNGVYLQYGKTKGDGAGTSKYKSVRAATSQSGYTRNTLSSLSQNVLSSSSYTSRLIYSGSDVIGISFRKDK